MGFNFNSFLIWRAIDRADDEPIGDVKFDRPVAAGELSKAIDGDGDNNINCLAKDG
jgi:hypothetical protein